MELLDIYDLLDKLGCNPTDRLSYVSATCPIHKGDSRSFVYYRDSGCYRCYSKLCHEIYGGKTKDLIKVLGNENKYSIINSNYNNIAQIQTIIPEKVPLYYCRYIKELGYTKDFCKKYEFGGIKNKRGYITSILFRIYNRDNVFIGYTKRLTEELRQYIYKKTSELPNKWIHNKGLKTSRILYNENRLDLKLGYAIIVEGVKDVLILERNNIKNSLATLGLGIKISQENKLIDWGIKKLYMCFDNDKAGLNYYYGFIDSYYKYHEPRSFHRTNKLFDVTVLTGELPINKDLDEISVDDLQYIFKELVL